jgi:hypothetical protein
MTDNEKRSLRYVLDGLMFPAQRWEIVTTADMYGADASTRERLQALPLRNQPFRSLQDVVDALDS